MPNQAADLIRKLYSPRTVLSGVGQQEIENALVAIGSAAVPELVTVLRSWRVGVVYSSLLSDEPTTHAMNALVRIGDPRGVEVLVDLLWRGGGYHASAAADALVRLGSREAAPYLAALLKSDSPYLVDVQCHAACCLARLAGRNDAGVLLKALDRLTTPWEAETHHKRGAAAREVVAGLLRNGADPRLILQHFAWERPSDMLVEAYIDAARGLARVAEVRDVLTLCTALDTIALVGKSTVHDETTLAAKQMLVARLEELGHPHAILRLLAQMHARYVTVEGLVRFGVEAIPEFLVALDSPHSFDVDKVLLALIGLGQPAIPALRARVAGPPSALSSRCAVALCRLGVREVELIPPVILAIERDWSRPLAFEALSQLVEWRSEPILRTAIPVLRKVANSWKFTHNLGLVPPTLHLDGGVVRVLEILERIERDTETLKAMPIVAEGRARSEADLPVVTQPSEL